MKVWAWVTAVLFRLRVWLRGHEVLTHEVLKARIRRGHDVHRPVWGHILRRDPCVYCNAVAPFASMTVEHVLPRSAKGPDKSTNIVGACGMCNRWRSSTPLLLFLLKRRGQWPNTAAERALDWELRSPRRDSCCTRRYTHSQPKVPLATVGDFIHHTNPTLAKELSS